MKIIFLDIDGVLNSAFWYEKRFKESLDIPYPDSEFDPETIQRLNRIIKNTKAKVVISSSWRSSKTIKEMQELFNRLGFVGEIIDFTPSFCIPHYNYNVPRGCEIDWWLDQQNFQRVNWSKEEQNEYIEKSQVKNYIIFDDDSDMLYGQREHFILTDRSVGLSEKDVINATEILNKSLIDLYYG